MTETVDASPPENLPPSGTDFIVPKRRLWPVFAVMLAIAATAGVFAFRELTAPVPLRVLIFIDLGGTYWEGSEPAAVLVDQLAERLTELGFEPVRGGDPETTRVLEKAKSPEQAAKKLRAAFVVSSKIDPKVEEHPIEGGYVELRVPETPLEVTHIGDGATETMKLTGFAGSKTKPEAMKVLARSMADQTLDAVLPALTKHPTIVELFSNRGDPKLAGKVTPARDYVATRKKQLDDAEAAYAALTKAHAEGEKGPAKVTYYGGFAAHDALAATSPKGALVQTADVRPWFSPDRRQLGWISALETLEWRTPSGEKKPLWAGYHILGYAGASPSGAPTVVVEDLFGWAKTITVIEENGASRRVRVDAKHRFVQPRVSPGGKFAAVYDRDCFRCPSGFLVLSLAKGEQLFKITPDETGIYGFAWLDARRVLFVRSPDPDAPTAFFVVDAGETPASISVMHRAAKGDGYGSPSVSADGKRIAVELRGTGVERIGIYDVDKATLARFDVGGYASEPEISADGSKVVFLLGRQDHPRNEVAVLDVASGTTSILTNNAFEEGSPYFSADGKTVFFESRDKDPNFPRNRVVSVIASVPVK